MGKLNQSSNSTPEVGVDISLDLVGQLLVGRAEDHEQACM